MKRTTAKAEAVASRRVCEPAEIEDDAAVRARVASGELVPLPQWGEPPVREHVVAQLRANVARPRTPAKTGGSR